MKFEALKFVNSNMVCINKNNHNYLYSNNNRNFWVFDITNIKLLIEGYKVILAEFFKTKFMLKIIFIQGFQFIC